MPRLPVILSLVFGATTLGLGAYVWQLQGDLARNDAAAQRLAEAAQQLRRRLADAPQAAPSQAVAPAPTAVEPASPEVPPPNAGAEPGPSAREARREAFLRSPEMQKIRQLDQREQLDFRFAALFRQLNLPPAELEKLKSLLIERDLAATDVYQAARAVGLNLRDSRAEIQKQVADAQAAVDASIRSTLGDAVFQQLQDYQQSANQRAIAGQLERRLSYTGTPLTPGQSDRLVAVLAAATPRGAGAPDQGGPEYGPNFRGLAAISDDTITQSRGFLSADQVAVLTQLRNQAQERAALRQQLRARVPSTGKGP